jgi:hypothetical protein
MYNPGTPTIPPPVAPNGEPSSYWPPVQPPRKNHTTRNVLLICAGAALIVGALSGIAAASHKASPAAAPAASTSPSFTPGTQTFTPQVTDPAGNTCASLDSAGYCPGDDPAPAAPAAPAPVALTWSVAQIQAAIIGLRANDGTTAVSDQVIGIPSENATDETADVHVTWSDGTVYDETYDCTLATSNFTVNPNYQISP